MDANGEIVVLGATGMLGRMVVAALRDTARVIPISRNGTPPRFDAERSATDLHAVLSPYAGATVINAVGFLASGMVRAPANAIASGIQVNAVFPHRLAAVAQELDQRVVHISSDAVFADDAGTVDEADVPSPTDPYGRSKLLGEPDAPNVVTIRCSIIGPNPGRGSGLWQWLANQPSGAAVDGYENHQWGGSTTRQVADLCQALRTDQTFAGLRSEGAVHHFAPNQPISKYQLLCYLRDQLRPDIEVREVRAPGGRTRLLTSRRRTFRELYPSPRDWPSILSESGLPE